MPGAATFDAGVIIEKSGCPHATHGREKSRQIAGRATSLRWTTRKHWNYTCQRALVGPERMVPENNMSARILRVEDERVTAEDLRVTLTELGYSSSAAVSSGPDAIAHAQGSPLVLLLMDRGVQGEMAGTATALLL